MDPIEIGMMAIAEFFDAVAKRLRPSTPKPAADAKARPPKPDGQKP